MAYLHYVNFYNLIKQSMNQELTVAEVEKIYEEGKERIIEGVTYFVIVFETGIEKFIVEPRMFEDIQTITNAIMGVGNVFFTKGEAESHCKILNDNFRYLEGSVLNSSGIWRKVN